MLLIGGRAPEFLRHNATLIKLVKTFQQQGKWILSICHGIQILLRRRDRPGPEPHLLRKCALRAGELRRHLGESGMRARRPIITGQTWGSHADFYREVFAQLGAG